MAMGVCWNHCFLCLSKLSLRNNRRTRSLGKKQEEADGSILIKYLYGSKRQKYDRSLQRILQLLKSQRISKGDEGSIDNSSEEKLINYCAQCDTSIKRVSELHKTLEDLEIIQMKLVDALRTMREKVLSNSKAYGHNKTSKSFFQFFENLDMAPGRKMLSEDRMILNLLNEFHDAVHEGHIAPIPYVFIKPISYFGSDEDTPCWDAIDTEVDRTECDNAEIVTPHVPQIVQYAAKIKQEVELEEAIDTNDFDDGIIIQDAEEPVEFRNKQLDPKPSKRTNVTKTSKSKRPKIKRKRITFSMFGSEEPCVFTDNEASDPDFDFEEEMKGIGRPRKHRLELAHGIKNHDDDDEVPGKCSRKKTRQCKRKNLKGPIVASAKRDHGKPDSSGEEIEVADELPIKLPLNTQKKKRQYNRKIVKGPQPWSKKEPDQPRRRFRCNTCPYVTMWRYNLEFHLRGHETSQKIRQCPDCEQQFSGEQFFNFHRTMHNGTFKIPCDFENCKEQVDVSSMAGHLKTHKIDKIFQCQYCLFCCATQANYYFHTARHLENRGRNPYKIACDICWEQFNNRIKFLSHVGEAHNIDLKLICNECSKTFLKPRHLALHMETHYGRGNEHETMIVLDRRNNNRYNCASCSYSTQKRFNFEYHLREHELENPAEFDTCPHCEEKFSGRQLYELHVQLHERRFKIACDIENCMEQVPVADMATHLSRIHQIKNGHRCKYCSFCCGTMVNYHYHLANHLEVGTEFHIPCVTCSATFPSRIEFFHHIYDEHMAIEQLICHECSKSFLDPRLLAQHKHCHAIKKTHACDECNACFSYAHILRKHMKTHSRREGKSSSEGCIHCGLRFISLRPLERHMIAVHKAPKAKCTYCDEEFQDYLTLMLHVEKEHQGCCFPCLLCEKTFETRQSWRRHQANHMLEQKFVCEECGKEFKNKAMFQKHRQIHSAVRSRECPYCDMAFRNGNTLRDHIRIHKGENPHVCELCGKAFRQRGTMNRHKQQVHQQQSRSLDLIIP